MRSLFLVLRSAVFLIVVTVAWSAPGARVEKSIDRDWTFQYFPEPRPDLRPAAPGFDDSAWPAVALPHTWSTYETTRQEHPFIRSATEHDDTYWWYGWGWYRKHFQVGHEYSGKLVALEFDGVQKYSKIYLNGVLVGEHKGGYTSFSVDVTKQVKFDADNVLSVQVSNRRDDLFGAIPPMTAGNFDVYGGIYREVRLVLTDRLHVPFQGSAEHEGGTFVTTPEVSADRATVRVRTWVQNDFPEARAATIVTTVRDADGKIILEAPVTATLPPGALHEFDQALGAVAHPKLWSPETPYLYSVTTEVREGSRLADTFHSPLGIRWFSWSYGDRRLVLNGKKILLRGINRHQEYPWLGDAMPKWMHQHDLEDIRHNMGLYFQRTVHYQNDPYVYQLCDQLGFILIEESPNIKDIAFGKPVQEQMIREMIRRDRNHPSIFIWSMGNETNQPADSAWAASEDASRLIYLRRSTNGGTHVQLTDHDLPIENLLRCTIRGWYNVDDHNFGVETGQPDGSQVSGTEEWQHERDRDPARLLQDNVVVWLYADHGCEREYLNSPLKNINPKGFVDAYRFPKYAYYLWQANFTRQPMGFIHPAYWREKYLGQRKNIVVDSNCDEVELKVNGVSLGRQKPSDANAHVVIFKDVEIIRGTLSLEGWQGTTRITSNVTMAGAPAKLLLRASAENVVADRAGIVVVSADIVDAQGVHVYGANPPLTWAVTGPGRLVGPARYETDTDKNNAMEGTMYIDMPVANVVRSTDVAGTIRVTVTADGLEPATVTVTSTAPTGDAVAGVVEPSVHDVGRVAVARDAAFKRFVFAAKGKKILEILQDADLTVATNEGYRQAVERFVRERNPSLDPFSAQYRAFVERVTGLVTERSGHVVADDYNFNARQLNEASSTKPKKKPAPKTAPL